MNKRIILKLSGEALAGEESAGINLDKVHEIALEVEKLYKQGPMDLGIVVGGGNIWRGRNASEYGIDKASADYMGMMATILNAIALQNALEGLGYETRVMTSMSIPAVAEPYIRRKALNHFEKGRILIFGGGTGLPFFSTDTTAALRAAELGATEVLMAKMGVDGVYDKDPRTNVDAKRFTHLTHDEVVSKHLKVMDATAATICNENNIDILVFDMNTKGNIAKAYSDPAIGTLISNNK